MENKDERILFSSRMWCHRERGEKKIRCSVAEPDVVKRLIVRELDLSKKNQ